MRKEWLISTAFDQLSLVPWYAVEREDHAAALPSWGVPVQEIDRDRLLDICKELHLISDGNFSRTDTRFLQESLGRALERGELLAFRIESERFAGESTPERMKPAEPRAAVATDWIALHFVNSEGRPMAEARYVLTLPDGREVRDKLDREGRARLDGIPSGVCNLVFPDNDAVQVA